MSKSIVIVTTSLYHRKIVDVCLGNRDGSVHIMLRMCMILSLRTLVLSLFVFALFRYMYVGASHKVHKYTKLLRLSKNNSLPEICCPRKLVANILQLVLGISTLVDGMKTAQFKRELYTFNSDAKICKEQESNCVVYY